MNAGRTLLLALAVPLASGATRAPEASRCIPLTNGSVALRVLDAGRIVYAPSPARGWTTRPLGRCVGLRANDTLLVDPFAGQLCRGDRFRHVSPGERVPSPPCRFDAFTPLPQETAP